MALPEASIFKLLADLNGKAAGFWQGNKLVLGSFIALAARFHGVKVSNNYATRWGWGLSAEASPDRRPEVHSGAGSFYSRYHLSLRRVGAWPIRWTGTQA